MKAWRLHRQQPMESTSSSINDEPIRVRDKVPLKLWLAMGAGMTERAAYYGSVVMIRTCGLRFEELG